EVREVRAQPLALGLGESLEGVIHGRPIVATAPAVIGRQPALSGWPVDWPLSLAAPGSSVAWRERSRSGAGPPLRSGPPASSVFWLETEAGGSWLPNVSSVSL